MKDLDQCQHYTIDQFMKVYRPDGFGYNTIAGVKQPFTEIICDICNKEITRDYEKNTPDGRPIHIVKENLMCNECFDKFYSQPEKHDDFFASVIGMKKTLNLFSKNSTKGDYQKIVIKLLNENGLSYTDIFAKLSNMNKEDVDNISPEDFIGLFVSGKDKDKIIQRLYGYFSMRFKLTIDGLVKRGYDYKKSWEEVDAFSVLNSDKDITSLHIIKHITKLDGEELTKLHDEITQEVSEVMNNKNLNVKYGFDDVLNKYSVKTKHSKLDNKSNEVKKLIENINIDPSDYSNPDVWYSVYNIPENDRMKNYQLMKKFLYSLESKSWIVAEGEEENDDNYRGDMFNDIISKMINKSKKYLIEDAEKNVIIHLNRKEKDINLQYDFMGVDCPLFIDDRKYFGFFIADLSKLMDTGGKFVPYVISVYAENDSKGESMLYPVGFNLLDSHKKGKDGENGKKLKKFAKFIENFLTFMMHKEIIYIKHEHNEKNAQRRKEKGQMEIPEYSTIQVSGQLKVYVDELNDALINKRRLPTSPFDVPKHRMHFWNKVKHFRLYNLTESDLEKKGYFIDHTLNIGVIYRYRKAHKRGVGVVKDKVHQVVR